jgi:glyoxylase-like metal-dependent hydrolase (beta-lactamase superfamily II)
MRGERWPLTFPKQIRLASQGYIAEPADILIGEFAESIPWQRSEICVFSTPGHTSGSLCVHLPGHLFRSSRKKKQ